MTSLTDDLRALLGDSAVSDGDADRSAYAHDLWPRQLIATRAGADRPPGPRAIVWPRDREQLASVVAFAIRHGVRITPFGAGSAVTGAISLGEETIAVDMKRMRALHAVDLATGTATADSGILGEHLEEQLARRGATLGHFPSSIYCSTLGGWIATRSAGQCSGRYGKIEDMVVALEGVLPTGEPFAAGPPEPGAIDARPLLVGSEGLFGFITRATMRIWPAPDARRFAAFSFATVSEASEAIRGIYQSGLRPAVARLYDPFDTYVFKSGGRSHASRTQSAGRRRPLSEYVLRRLLARPAMINGANRRFGEKVFGRSLLVLMFEGTARDGLDDALERATRIALGFGGKDTGDALARRWLERRHAVSYRQPPVFARGLWVDTMEVAAPWSRIDALYHEVHEALATGGFVMAHFSHAYPDGCAIYFTFAGGDADDRDALQRYLATWNRALTAAHHAGGTIAHHHGVGRSKRGAMRLELGAGVDVIDRLGAAADPSGIMARGVLVPDGASSVAVARGPSSAIAVDAASRLCTTLASTPMRALIHELESHALTLPDAASDGVVATWLSARLAPAAPIDPVDHVAAGYVAVLPNGAVASAVASPRRATGPDLFTLFAHGDARYGLLAAVTLRVRGADEAVVQSSAPCEHSRTPLDPALASWLARVDLARS